MKITHSENFLKIALPVLVLWLVTGSIAHSTTYVWSNTAGGNWNVAADWSPNGMPGSGDTADISASGTYTVTVNTAESVGTLTMNGTSGMQTLNISSSGTLTINSASTGNANAVVEVSGGTLTGTGSLTLAGILNWTSGTISSGVSFAGGGFSGGSLYLDGGLLTNNGVLYWTNNATLYDGNGSVFTNLPGATIIVSNAYSGGSWLYGGDFPGSHVFGNGGTITVDATGLVMVYTENFVNAGTLTVNSGTLQFYQGTNVDSGPVTVAPTATLELGGADTFTPASSISGLGEPGGEPVDQRRHGDSEWQPGPIERQLDVLRRQHHRYRS